MPEGAVTLLYEPGPPARYVARLGDGGWCEGWGWDVDEAVASLARAIEQVQPSGQVPVEAPVDRQCLVAWLTEEAPAPILAP